MNGAELIEGACVMNLLAFVSVPASWSQKKRQAALDGLIRPTTKPDLDNILKGVCDALNGIIFTDDKQVAHVSAAKWYAATPRLEVSVESI